MMGVFLVVGGIGMLGESNATKNNTIESHFLTCDT